MGQPGSYLTLSDLAKELDVKKSHIRFCEENGFISPKVTKLKRRVYNIYDRERLKLIFHFVLLGYSKEHIADLIGIPDANLDENGQLVQGIEYGEKKLKELEKRKEQLSFTKQTSIIKEIGMVHAYIKKLKNIKSGVIEKSEAKSSLKFEKGVKAATESPRGLKVKTGKKPTQQPLRVISLFVGGLVLVIIIGSYFYYQLGQKETQTTKAIRIEQTRSETYRVNQETVPLDQTVKAQTMAPETQKIPKAASKESAPAAIQRIKAMQAESKPGLFESKKPPGKQNGVGKEGTVSKDDAIQAEIAQLTASIPIEKTPPATKGVSLLPEEQKSVDFQAKADPETDMTKKAAEKPLTGKALPAVSGEDTLSATAPDAVKEKILDTEVKAPSTELEKEKERKASTENIGKQEDLLSRMKSFLSLYCRTYTNKDLDKFITFFTSEATENNRPFHELVPEYRKNMENAQSLSYRIEITSYTKQGDKNILMYGNYFTRYQLQGGGWKENSGSISMELLETGDLFLVKKLTY